MSRNSKSKAISWAQAVSKSREEKFMRKKKKWMSLLLTFALLVSLCACGGKAETDAKEVEKKEDTAANSQDTEEKVSGEKASGETYLLRAANTNNEDSYSGNLTKMLFDMVAEKSDGRVVPEYYFSGSLGDKSACMEGMLANTIQAADLAATDLAVYEPGWSVFALPFLFDGDPDTELACYQDEEFFDYLDQSLQEKGFKLLLFYTTGYRNPLNTKREIRTPEDANGIRLRVLQNTYLAKSFELMGFSPVTLGWSEVYSALQQGTVDGAEQSASLLLDNQLADYGKHLTVIDAIGICGTFVMSLEYYNSLPEDIQQIIDESSREVMDWEWKDFSGYEAGATEALIEKGVTITELTDDEKQVFIDKIAGVKDQMFEETPATKAFYEEIQEALERTK